jgi:hypothetical protein
MWLRIAIETSNGHYPVVPPADQQDARPDAGEVRRAHARLCRDLHFHLGDAVDQV